MIIKYKNLKSISGQIPGEKHTDELAGTWWNSTAKSNYFSCM